MILDDVTVIDLSRVMAGPLAAQHLADHGADVIKVEAPQGDDTRKWGPPFAADGTTGYYNALNRNKRNICIDLKSAQGQEVLAALLAEADVLIENFKTGTLDRWGFTRERIETDFPRLIHCRITGYGADGPFGGLPGYDAVLQAFSGIMSITGEPDGPPLRLGMPAVDLVTGLNSFSGILLALRDRERTGVGQLLDSTLLDNAMSMLIPQASNWLYGGGVPHRTGAAHPTVAPYEVFHCTDGDIFVAGGNDAQFARICTALDAPELIADPRFAANADRIANRAELSAALQSAMGSLTRGQLLPVLSSAGVPAAAVNTVPETFDEPQVRHREIYFDDDDGFRGVRNPIVLSSHTLPTPKRPTQTGENSIEVLRELGFTPTEVSSLVSSGAVSAVADTQPASATTAENSRRQS